MVISTPYGELDVFDETIVWVFALATESLWALADWFLDWTCHAAGS